MTEFQALLDHAIGAPPPSTVDVETVVARERRRARHRQYGILATAAAVTLSAAVAFATLPPRGGAAPPGQPPPTAVTSQSATSSQPATPGTPVVDHNAERMTQALKQALTTALPRARFLPNRPAGENQVDALVFDNRSTHYYATAEITDAAGTGSIYVSVGRMETSFREERACSSDPKPLDVDVLECETRNGPAGSLVMVLYVKRGGLARYRVEVLRPDGTGVVVEVSNGSEKDADQPIGRRPTPPLAKNQAVTLAQNPAFVVTPP